MSNPIVTCRGVTKVFGKGDLAVHALAGVDLDFAPGDFATLAGPSGSGKTTLLNMIGALDTPTAGEVSIAGNRLNDMNKSQLSDLRLTKIGFVFQSLNLIPVLSAVENVEFVLELQHCPAAEQRERAIKVLEQVGLKGMENRRPSAMSGGQQQRVAVARALVTKPAIVLADEPTANLDSKNSSDLMDLMAQLNADLGITFVIGTHDVSVMKRSRRHLEMLDGRISSDTRR
ncbi:MAG: ABC transporter ATP-binding protein [Rhodobacteraceae bacterium]|nr:ABC transporter ATP-binding protein [Paracoccaceae bacterium]